MELYTAHLKLCEFGRADWPDVHEYYVDPQMEATHTNTLVTCRLAGSPPRTSSRPVV
jgi:hypothetical protein